MAFDKKMVTVPSAYGQPAELKPVPVPVHAFPHERGIIRRKVVGVSAQMDVVLAGARN